MLCPACCVEMLVLEFELVEIDHCMQCGGVWLDSGELELIGRRAGVLQGRFLAALESQEGEPARQCNRCCPVCRKRLSEISTNAGNKIVLDRCPDRHGLWFDGGELAAVVKAAGIDDGNVLARFLANLDARRQEAKQSAERPVS
jgi:Zn-finger nucleic acid-binding protein